MVINVAKKVLLKLFFMKDVKFLGLHLNLVLGTFRRPLPDQRVQHHYGAYRVSVVVQDVARGRMIAGGRHGGQL